MEKEKKNKSGKTRHPVSFFHQFTVGQEASPSCKPHFVLPEHFLFQEGMISTQIYTPIQINPSSYSAHEQSTHRMSINISDNPSAFTEVKLTPYFKS